MPREVEALVARDGMLGFRHSVEARKACCEVRKVRPLNRALAGAAGWITGLRREQSAGRARGAVRRLGRGAQPHQAQPDRRLDARAARGLRRRPTTFPSTRCTRRASPRSAASPARAPSGPAKTSAPAAGGGRTRTARNAGCTTGPRHAGRSAPHDRAAHRHLDLLEAESIHIFREAAAQFRKPVLLYSIGKDSTVLLHLARKAFWPDKLPFPLLHVDTTWKFRDMIAFRDRTVRELGLDLIVHTNEDGIARGINPIDYRALHLHRRDEDAGAEAGARQARASTPPSAARAATRRPARQGARVLVPRGGPPLGPAPAAPRDVAPAQRPPRRRRDGARVPAVQLDREGRLALHRCARSSTSCRSTSPPSGRPSCATASCWCSTTTACRCSPARRSQHAARPLPHARLLAADGGRRVRRRRSRSVVAETLDARTSERQGRLIDHDQAGAMEKKEAGRLLLMTALAHCPASRAAHAHGAAPVARRSRWRCRVASLSARQPAPARPAARSMTASRR